MSASAREFATTQWTLVWQAAQEKTGQARPAFAELFTRYRQPLYFAARKKGLSQEDSEDAIQNFFSKLLDDSFLRKADPASGRFRAYLSVAWKRFLIDCHRHEVRQKRGGDHVRLPLDIATLESNWQANADAASEYEQLFSRNWAASILAMARARLADEYAGRGRLPLFHTLIDRVSTPLDARAYSQIASEADVSEGAIKVAMHRLRRRFGETLRDIVAETVSDPSEIDAELDELLKAMSE